MRAKNLTHIGNKCGQRSPKLQNVDKFAVLPDLLCYQTKVLETLTKITSQTLDQDQDCTDETLKDPHRIWNGEVYRSSERYWPLKSRILINSMSIWQTAVIFKNRHSSAAVWPIGMKFGTVTYTDTQNSISKLSITLSRLDPPPISSWSRFKTAFVKIP